MHLNSKNNKIDMKKLDIQEHFQVPEGYFDDFTSRMMSMLPEQDFQPMKVDMPMVQNGRRISPMVARIATAAAVVVLMLVSTYTLFSAKQMQQADEAVFSSAEELTGSYNANDAAEYAMLDRQDFLEMVTEL